VLFLCQSAKIQAQFAALATRWIAFLEEQGLTPYPFQQSRRHLFILEISFVSVRQILQDAYKTVPFYFAFPRKNGVTVILNPLVSQNLRVNT
jgi:hypothetical protein